jgi:hypothetical protein
VVVGEDERGVQLARTRDRLGTGARLHDLEGLLVEHDLDGLQDRDAVIGDEDGVHAPPVYLVCAPDLKETATFAVVRYLAVEAGPFRLALPLEAVRQILDVGGEQASAPSDPRALGVTPCSLALLLGSQPSSPKPALLLFDGHSGPVLLSTCALGRVFDGVDPAPLPKTVACRWPGLIQGALDDAGLRLVLDPRVLMGLVEAL